jgi:archaemetzincin
MGVKRIILVPLTTHGVLEYLDALNEAIGRKLREMGLEGLDVLTWPDTLKPPMKCFDWSRLQYHGGCIVRYLREVFQLIGLVDSSLVVGVGYLDGYEYGLNFVFGEASPDQHVAVVFTKRLKPEYYGEQARFDLYFERLVKETLHELGHLMGLEHCSNYCVMRFSNSILEVDEKPAEYCGDCVLKIKNYISRTK